MRRPDTGRPKPQSRTPSTTSTASAASTTSAAGGARGRKRDEISGAQRQPSQPVSRRGREGAEGTISQKVSLQWLNIVHIPWHLLLRMFGKERKAPKGACSCCMMTSRHTLSKGFSLSGVYIVKKTRALTFENVYQFSSCPPSAYKLICSWANFFVRGHSFVGTKTGYATLC